MKNLSDWFQSNGDVYTNFLVAHALSSKRHLHKEIAEVYQQRELVYYKAYRSYDVDLQQSFCHYPFEQVNAMIQCLGILQVAHEEQSYDKIWTFIRKGFGSVWKHCKIHKSFSFETMTQEIAKRSNGFLEADETANLFVVGLYLSFNKEDIKPFTAFYELDKHIILFLGDLLDKFRHEPENRVPLFSENHEQVGKDSSLEDLEQHVRLFRKSENIEEYIGKIIQFEVEKYRKRDTASEMPHPILQDSSLGSSSILEQLSNFERHLENMSNEEDVMDALSQEGWSKYLISLRGLLIMHNFDPTTLGKQQGIEKGMIKKMYQLIGFLREDYNYSEQELMLTLSFHYYLSIIEAEYTKLRQLASDGSRERFMTELESLQLELTSLQEEKRQTDIAHLSETKSLQVQLTRALEENQKLSQQVRRMEKYQEGTVNHEQEVLALRRYISNHINQRDVKEQLLSAEQMAKEIQKKNIAIVGGHHKWQRKMKELLPKAKFIYVDDINRDFNALLSVDAVFFNDTVLNHGFSYKLMDVMENSEVPIYYLSNAVNRERSIKEIYEYIVE